jgi:O-antigen ligase
MRKATFWLLSLAVFCIPWEEFFVAFNVSSITRLIGIMTIALGILTVATSGQMRRPNAILFMAFAFTSISALSLLWTISSSATVGRAFQYGQLLGFVWLLSEFVRTDEERQVLMVAYTIGGYVSMIDLLRRFFTGVGSDLRYSATNLNPNDLGLTLAIGIPMAWHLVLIRRGVVRALAAIYIPLVGVAILLTASRGAALAFLVALSAVPLTLSRRSLPAIAAIVVALAAAAGAAALVVPPYNWDRVLNTGQELAGGTMSGRAGIWATGWDVFKERPVLGFGGGAFEGAVEPLIGRKGAHNVFLAVAVEQGVVGLSIFGALLATCAWLVWRMAPADRKTWGVVGLTWVVGAMSAGWQYRKETWLLLGLMTVHATSHALSRQRSGVGGIQSHRQRPRAPTLLRPVYSRAPAHRGAAR